VKSLMFPAEHRTGHGHHRGHDPSYQQPDGEFAAAR
jgi:hypothetical protein